MNTYQNPFQGTKFKITHLKISHHTRMSKIIYGNIEERGYQVDDSLRAEDELKSRNALSEIKKDTDAYTDISVGISLDDEDMLSRAVIDQSV